MRGKVLDMYFEVLIKKYRLRRKHVIILCLSLIYEFMWISPAVQERDRGLVQCYDKPYERFTPWPKLYSCILCYTGRSWSFNYEWNSFSHSFLWRLSPSRPHVAHEAERNVQPEIFKRDYWSTCRFPRETSQVSAHSQELLLIISLVRLLLNVEKILYIRWI